MIKKLFIIGITGATLVGMQGPSSSATSSLSESSENGQERSVRERQVKKMKNSPVPVVAGRPQLDPRAEMLIERAAASQAEIDNFFLDLTDQQIRVLNKIIFYHKLDQAAHLFATEQATFNAFPEFIKQLFSDTQEQESEQQESKRGY